MIPLPAGEFEAFRFDQGRADAMADALREVLRLARLHDVTAVDQVAALALVIADVLAQSSVAARPQVLTGVLARFIDTQVASRRAQAGR